MKKNFFWNQQETELLIRSVKMGIKDNGQLSKILKIPIEKVYEKRWRLGLKEDNWPRSQERHRSRKGWSELEVEKLKRFKSLGHSNDEIAHELKRTGDAVRRKWDKVCRAEEIIQAQITYQDSTNKVKDSDVVNKTSMNERSKVVKATEKTEVSLLWGLFKYTKS